MKTVADIAALVPEMKSWRHHIHAHPETAFEESATSEFVAEKLRVTEIPVRLIYNDPNRYFGGLLDDAQNRLRHYLDVLNSELQGWACEIDQSTAESCCTGCCH